MENMEMEVVKPQTEALVEVEQSRAIAETQAAMIIAKRFPRDPVKAKDRIVNACGRPGLAEAALYEYARGGTPITGPSIRLAEAIAQNWGNLQFGIRELEQRNGESTVEAFAWDVETNTREVKVFQVAHKRYTRKGTYKLEDPRDIYEMTANQGARRLRSCILGIVPGDVVEEAVKQCESTLRTKAEITPERVSSLLDKFFEFGVSKKQIEARIQRHVDTITPAQLINLGKIYNSLKDGMSVASDWFDVEEQAAKPNKVDALKDKLRKAEPQTEEITPEEEKLAQAQAELEAKREQAKKDLQKHEEETKTPEKDIPEKPNMIEWLKIARPSTSLENAKAWLKAYEDNEEDIDFLEDRNLRNKLQTKKDKTENWILENTPPDEPPLSPGEHEQHDRRKEFNEWCEKVKEKAGEAVIVEACYRGEYQDIDDVPEIDFPIFRKDVIEIAQDLGSPLDF